MTTISTAGIIAAVREAAHMTKTQEERDVLNGIANRVEMLAEANSIKSLELDSIRQALKIPGSDSVQAGTIAAFCKLQSDFDEVTALANRLRRTAKEYQEENQGLRSEKAALEQQLAAERARVVKLPPKHVPNSSNYIVIAASNMVNEMRNACIKAIRNSGLPVEGE